MEVSNNMINSMYFPANSSMDVLSQKLINVFSEAHHLIDSENSETNKLQKRDVVLILSEELNKIGFIVNHNGHKYSVNRISSTDNSFVVSAYNEKEKYVLQIEAGRGIMNNEYIKDYLEACLMTNADYLCIAVKNNYINNNDFETACNFFKIVYDNHRLNVPLKGLLIIGY